MLEEPSYLRSGKRYRVESEDHSPEHHPSSSRSVKSNPSVTNGEEGGSIPYRPTTPKKTLGEQGNPIVLLQSGSSSQTPPSSQGTPPVQQTQPPRRSRVDDDIKLPLFRGTGLEDPEYNWFFCEAVWNVKRVQDDAIKMAQLITMFRDRALTQFMKYSLGKVRTLANIRATLISELKKPKLESQCITKLKDIKKKPSGTVWEYDQKFKTLSDQVSFEIEPQRHQEWFIVVLLPHIRLPLMQQKVASQAQELEIVMNLEVSHIVETSFGMAQIQSQLINITLQLQDINKCKERREEVWCTKCIIESHSKEHCPIFVEYLANGEPNPLPQTQDPWCEIYRTNGHKPQYCYLLQQYVLTPKNQSCTFCKFVGHDENNCRAYELMMERTQDVYVVHSDQHNNIGNMEYDQGRTSRGGFRGCGHNGGFGRGRGQIICYNCGTPRHYIGNYTNPTTTCKYCKSYDHTIEDCPILLAKKQEKRQQMGNQNVLLIGAKECTPEHKLNVVMQNGLVTNGSHSGSAKKLLKSWFESRLSLEKV